MRHFAENLKLRKCSPTFWARSGHVQTILGHILPSEILEQTGEKLHIPLDDGDTLVSFLLRGSSSTVIYLFHGLGGTSHGKYMQRIARTAHREGHTVIMTNHRGCGEGTGLAQKPYHSGRAEDLSSVILWGKNQFPEKKHLAIGFSLSGNAVLLLAANQRGHVQPDAAISVNAPINLERASELLGTGLNRLYDYRFVRDMEVAVNSRKENGFSVPDINFNWRLKLSEFDDLYTAPESGFRNRLEYYQTCSARAYLKHVNIPTLMLTAADDPFVSCLDYLSVQHSPYVLSHIEKYGGHMGYVTSDKILGTHRWMDYALMSYIRSFAVV